MDYEKLFDKIQSYSVQSLSAKTSQLNRDFRLEEISDIRDTVDDRLSEIELQLQQLKSGLEEDSRKSTRIAVWSLIGVIATLAVTILSLFR